MLLLSAGLISKSIFSKKIFQEYSRGVKNLDPDQAQSLLGLIWKGDQQTTKVTPSRQRVKETKGIRIYSFLQNSK